MEILSTAQMRAIESEAMTSGAITGPQLMERAGAAVAGQIRLAWPKAGRATVLCGPGNNGGDGYVIALLLRRAGWRVRVLGCDGDPGPDAAEMRRRWRQAGPVLPLTPQAFLAAPPGDICVDAVFGTGLTRPPAREIAQVLALLPGEDVVAVDCPSGLCLDSGVLLGRPRAGDAGMPRARLTVAFDSPKPGHLLGLGPAVCGRLVIADIGLGPWRQTAARGGPEDRPDGRPGLVAIAQPATAPRDGAARSGLRALLAKHSPAHKFSHGHALILAGGVGAGGAARLAARAALRIGAGLVTIGPPAEALAEHAGPPDALMRRAVDAAPDLSAMLGDARLRAICIGPGCGTRRAAALLPAALGSGRPCVLDADALTALAADADLAAGLHAACVLTPHAGEFARLFPDLAARLDAVPARGPAVSRLDVAREAAARCGAVVLLKGPDSVIAVPDGRAMIHSAVDVPWLATAGSGDSLAGLIAGAMARGVAPCDAAGLAVILHAMAARSIGAGLIADDIPDRLPAILRGIGA
ncbi:NAD(P)H-hydrate dehydratase [Paracoccus spongiarum]|uniref:Bifunctional NAD(P)H-hydrate repair enzyme n=1 Tax=Paracoccus spongiarum TaxID=3064387 RepID=A0ABT9JDR5_9RHOB|nr:NAD(P)H-hydrate dehydratase [Paracoccus sp. 2205BS29-5]MDP5307974.1 NAD(P)H-hydrate dehydratase [Paracoccus sp. 2205BS29-5]